ncbi:MAG: hypothetical protein JSR29_09195 [Nitrospira sp.]|nr:hypothetical protein [Nitrospira sp.]
MKARTVEDHHGIPCNMRRTAARIIGPGEEANHVLRLRSGLYRSFGTCQMALSMQQLARRTDSTSRWDSALKARRGFNKALVALAAKHARILWVMLATSRPYQPAGAGA